MGVEFNHTIINVRDKRESSKFVSEILGLSPAVPFGPFLVLKTSNGVSLDFIDSTESIEPQHYAFLVSETEFDEIFGRIVLLKLPYWADPAKKQMGEIYHYDGGRGVYFEDPSKHFLEILTRPYRVGK